MAFLDRLSKIDTSQERNAMVQENIGLGGNEGIAKRLHFFVKRCAYVKYFLILIHILNSNNILYYVKGSSAWFANAKDSLFGQDFLADPRNITCEGIVEYLLNYKPEFQNNHALLASFLPQNWDISIFAPNPEEMLITIKQHLDEIREMMIKDPRIIPQERQTRKKAGETLEERVLDIDVNISNQGADTFKGGYVSLCRIENKVGNKYGEFDDEAVCTKQIEEDQSHRVGFLIFWVSIYKISGRTYESEELTLKTDFISKITHKLPATIFPGGAGIQELSGINANFLNAEGLALNSIFMESSGVDRRLEKKLDIDSLRINALLTDPTTGKIIPEAMVAFYSNILTIWKTGFSTWEQKDANAFFSNRYQYDAVQNTIEKNILKYHIVDGNSVLNNIETYLITVYRATVNNIIMDIYDKSRTLVIEGVESVNIFIVGGDAFGRYIEEGKMSDIDVKLVITPIAKISKKRKQGKIPVIPNSIKNEIINFISDILSPYIIYLNYINKFIDKPTFRIRSYDASQEKSPYSLISLDCRGNLDIETVGITGFFLEYAILDIAIMYNYEHTDYTKYIHNSICNGEISLPSYLVDADNIPKRTEQIRPIIDALSQVSFLPIANALFLLSELETRYENPSSVEARFFAGKIEKDISRYITLRKLIHDTKSYDPIIKTRNIMDPFLWYSMKLITKIENVTTYLGCVYARQFDAIRLGIKKLEMDYPDRHDEKWKYIIKAKTTFDSGHFIFCNEEYILSPDSDLMDIRYFMGECQNYTIDMIDPGKNIAEESDRVLRANMSFFCQVLNRTNGTLFNDIMGTIESSKEVLLYLGIEPR